MAPAAEASAAYPLDSKVGDWDTLVGQGWTWLPPPSCELEAKDIRRARLLGVSEPHLRRLHQAAKQMQDKVQPEQRQARESDANPVPAAPQPPAKRKGWKGFWDRIKPRREEHWAVQGLKWVGIVAGATLIVAVVVGGIMLMACVAAGCVMACAVLEDSASYTDRYGKRWHSKYDCPWYRRH